MRPWTWRAAGLAALVLAAATTSVTAQSPSSASDVDAYDLKVNPRRYAGQWVRVRGFHCYAAAFRDYRCINDEAAVAVSTALVTPAEAQSGIDATCATVRAAATSDICGRPFVFKVIGWKEAAARQGEALLVFTAGHIDIP